MLTIPNTIDYSSLSRTWWKSSPLLLPTSEEITSTHLRKLLPLPYKSSLIYSGLSHNSPFRHSPPISKSRHRVIFYYIFISLHYYVLHSTYPTQHNLTQNLEISTTRNHYNHHIHLIHSLLSIYHYPATYYTITNHITTIWWTRLTKMT